MENSLKNITKVVGEWSLNHDENNSRTNVIEDIKSQHTSSRWLYEWLTFDNRSVGKWNFEIPITLFELYPEYL